jgi:aryl-alcohol dehydrogenase-like predicted oxidoreductase
MKTRKLGKVGPEVSAIGLGCMGMSDFYGSRATRDDAESVATIRAALDAGVTLLNTGDFYGVGHNELLLREALRGRPEQPLISVKFGALRTPAGAFSGYDSRPQAVKNFAAYSLVRLGVEAIGVYQPARVDPAVPIEDTVGAIKELIEEGKVRYLGLSEASPEQLRRAHKVHPVAALEIEYSLATRVVERELLQAARELGVAVVAYGVLVRGMLPGTLPAQLHPGDFRAHNSRFSGEARKTNDAKVAQLAAFAAAKGCTPAQLAIAWALHRGDDVIPVLGTTKRARLAENLGALEVALTPAEVATLDAAFPDGSFAGERYDGHGARLIVK